jgi:hypothetical protein
MHTVKSVAAVLDPDSVCAVDLIFFVPPALQRWHGSARQNQKDFLITRRLISPGVALLPHHRIAAAAALASFCLSTAPRLLA